jgi:cytochrome c5
MKNHLVLAICLVLLLPAAALSMTGEEVYQKSCAMCHNSGVAGAPKLGDKDAWEERATEKDELYQTAIHGKGAMPAKGGNAALNDDEVKSAVDYMIEKSK